MISVGWHALLTAVVILMIGIVLPIHLAGAQTDPYTGGPVNPTTSTTTAGGGGGGTTTTTTTTGGGGGGGTTTTTTTGGGGGGGGTTTTTTAGGGGGGGTTTTTTRGGVVGGVVISSNDCPPHPTIRLDPEKPGSGEAVRVISGGHVPGQVVNIYLDDVLVGSGPADANGNFTFNGRAPLQAPNGFIFCASGPPCAMVCIDPTFVSAVRGRGFARTGYDVGPWLLVAAACLIAGRRLVKMSRRPRERRASSGG